VGAGLPLIARCSRDRDRWTYPISGARAASPVVAPGAEPGSTGVPAERTVTLEDGTNDRDIIQVDQPKDQPIIIKFTQNHRALGALTLLPFPKDDLFKVHDVVDAQNHPVVEYSNDSRGGSKNVLQNSDTLHVRFENKIYLLRVTGLCSISTGRYSSDRRSLSAGGPWPPLSACRSSTCRRWHNVS
jgi:hypothetical protein